MSRYLGSFRGGAWLVVVFATMIAPSCNREPTQPPPSLLPDLNVARRAVEDALEEWRDSPGASTTTPGRRMMFIDDQRQPGQQLLAFEILGQTEVDNCRRFVVRLSLTEPDESVLAAYYVFGADPIWVYRAEDFDMMMHMDMTPEDAPPPVESGGNDSGESASPASPPGS